MKVSEMINDGYHYSEQSGLIFFSESFSKKQNEYSPDIAMKSLLVAHTPNDHIQVSVAGPRPVQDEVITSRVVVQASRTKRTNESVEVQMLPQFLLQTQSCEALLLLLAMLSTEN